MAARLSDEGFKTILNLPEPVADYVGAVNAAERVVAEIDAAGGKAVAIQANVSVVAEVKPA